jgi:hypothetical protein
MVYYSSRSPSGVDNLALRPSIHSMAVEDAPSISQQTPPYCDGNHVSSGVPGTFPHIRVAAPSQPRGPYASFPPPGYALYYPGSHIGQRHKHLQYPFLRTFVRPVHVCTLPHRSKCITSKLGSTGGSVYSIVILAHAGFAVLPLRVATRYSVILSFPTSLPIKTIPC